MKVGFYQFRPLFGNPIQNCKKIIAALKDGKDKADIKAKAEMGKITEGLNLPAGMKLPF